MTAPTVTEPKSDDVATPLGHHLVVRGPEGSMPMVLPEEGVLSIGRDDEADVRVGDLRASRNHARLHIGARYELEDLGSVNGTRVRDLRLEPGGRVPLELGDPVTIGDTVLTIEWRKPGFEARRVWAHGYFETRLIEECARAQSRGATLALLRLHADEAAPAAKVERILRAELPPGDLLAAYSPHEYEALLLDVDAAAARTLADAMVAALAAQKVGAQAALASYPMDGASPQRLMTVVCERARGETAPGSTVAAVVVESRAMRELYALARRTATGSSNVLILGEAGSGRELLAEGIHRLSGRGDRPFFTLNCAAFDEARLDHALFGTERGVDPDAPDGHVGVLEAATGGTLFLDDIAEMRPEMQVKLQVTIESRQILRQGAAKARPLDVRFLAATNRDLGEDENEQRFRRELLAALDPVTLQIPPLRERAEEIASLVRLFLKRLAPPGRSPAALSPEALALLRAYSWPGNVRELRNVVERAAVLCGGGTITEAHLPADRMRRSAWPLVPSPVTAPITQAAAAAPARDVKTLERKAMVDALRRCHGNVTRAAELMGMPRRAFTNLMLEHRLGRPRT
jgi:two-component system response regulator AtoC